jgi:uncharacterized LabA/DUF88 family protein
MEDTKTQFSFHLFEKSTLVVIDWFNIWNKHNEVDLKLFFDYLKTYTEIYQIRFYNGLIESKDWSQKILDDANSLGYEVVSKKSKQITIDIYKESHLKKALDLLGALLFDISDKNNEIWNKLYTLHEEVEKKLSDGVSDSEVLDVLEHIESDLKKLNIQIDTFKIEIQKPIKKPKCDFDAEIARDLILEMDNYENVILFSGDGDFASTINLLVQNKNKRAFVVYPSGSYGEPDYIDTGLVYFNEEGEKFFKKGFRPVPVYRILDKITKKAPADFSAGPDINNVSNTGEKVNNYPQEKI